MLCLNLGHVWNFTTNVKGIEGVTYLASGNSYEKLLRKPLTEFTKVIFDPQLYLAGLTIDGNETICGRLGSYPWFGLPDMPQFDSDVMTRREWEAEMVKHATANWIGSAPSESHDIVEAVTDVLEFQSQLPCTHMLLPTPLITEREDEAEVQALWIDEGLAAASALDLGQPLIATVALSDMVINDSAFDPASFMDTVVDQISSREGLSGVYIVIAQTNNRHPLSAQESTLEAYAHLVRRFDEQSYDMVMTNFSDVYGLACYALGATDMGIGHSHSLRRLSIAPPSGGRGPLPVFYSHKTIGEYRTETDLDKVRDFRALRRIDDPTEISRPLFNALRRGDSASMLTKWAESQNNVKESRRHFLRRLVVAEEEMADLDWDERPIAVQEWLDDAAAERSVVESRVGDHTFKGTAADANLWLSTLNLPE